MAYVVVNRVQSQFKTRRATLHGRPHLVVPLSMIVPGVLNGSQGRLYYPPEEVGRRPGAWNGMPILVGHPVLNGRHVSGRSPEVWEQYGIGWVFSANFTSKLRAEGWFDEERTRAYDRIHGTTIWNKLERGEPFELSTGLYTVNEPKAGVDPHGRAYDFIARDYVPDHLAILLDQPGACSVQDGCGVLVNDAAPPGINAAQGQPRSKVTGYYKMLGAGTGMGDTHEHAQAGAMVVTEEQKRLGAEATKELAETGHNPASWVRDHRKWERAKRAASRYADEGPDTFYAVVTHIYQNMGGRIKSSTQNSVVPTPPETEQPNHEGDLDMDRTAMIAWLVANCACWKGKDKVLANKDTFSDEDLKTLKTNTEKAQQAEAVANAAREGFQTLYGVQLATNADIAGFVKQQTDQRHAAEEAAKRQQTQTQAPNQPPPPAVDVSGHVRNYLQSLTPQQWLDLAPADVKSGVATAMEITRTERENLLTRITANASTPEAKAALRQIYDKLDNTALRVVAASIPAVSSPMMSGSLPAFNQYLGATPPPASVTPTNNDPGDLLDLPTLNFTEMVEEQLGRRASKQSTGAAVGS